MAAAWWEDKKKCPKVSKKTVGNESRTSASPSINERRLVNLSFVDEMQANQAIQFVTWGGIRGRPTKGKLGFDPGNSFVNEADAW